MKNIILGIDTSNYTTSVSLLGNDGELLANIKKHLPVSKGECGLRQSEAVFSHIKNIPSIMEEARSVIGDNKILAVGVSATPRKQPGSYMPCFLSGVSLAEGIAAALNVPIYRFSHQCGHIMAAIYSSGNFSLLARSFGAFHISGGTTELIRIEKYSSQGFDANLVGGTKDLNAGQIIDRIGVFMGLGFPAGQEMEKLAICNKKPVPKRKISSLGMEVNLSGLENLAKKLYTETYDKQLTSAFVFDYISRSIAAMGNAYIERFGKEPLVFAGGVMSNSIIKSYLSDLFDASFAEPQLSADNAVGIGYLTLRAHFG